MLLSLSSGKSNESTVKAEYLTVIDTTNFWSITRYRTANSSQEITLKRAHSYYMHVSGQSMVSGCDFCDFVGYCPKDAELFVQRVYPNKEFMLKTLI